jgi:hypothetical protein
MDCMTALSLLSNEVSYLNFISVEGFKAEKLSSKFQRCLLEVEGSGEFKRVTSEVSAILCVSNCSVEPGNGMLIGRLFVQVFKGFSAVVRYLCRGGRKRLFAVSKERTFHLSVGMSPSFSTSPKIMDQDDTFFVNSLGGRFLFQVEHQMKYSEWVLLGTKHSLHQLLLIFNRLSTTL